MQIAVVIKGSHPLMMRMDMATRVTFRMTEIIWPNDSRSSMVLENAYMTLKAIDHRIDKLMILLPTETTHPILERDEGDESESCSTICMKFKCLLVVVENEREFLRMFAQ